MDEKELKRLLEKELDSIAPPMSEKVKKAKILTEPEQAEKSTQKIDIRPTARKNRGFVFGAIAAVLVIAIALSVILPAALSGGEEPVFAAGYLRMDINPSVEFVYGEDMKVIAVKSANSDADLLVTDEVRKNVVGKDVNEAAAIVAEEAGRLGYIEPGKDNAVKITVVGKNDDDVLKQTTVAIESNFMQKGVLCAVVAVKESTDYLAGLYGTAADDLKGALDNVCDKADGYFEQLAKENTDSLEELRAYYETEVFEYLRGLLEAECAKITKTRTLLHEAQNVNDAIKDYTFDKTLLVKDYWAVVETGDWQEDEQLAALCKEMKELLDKAAALRDDKVDNSAELDFLVFTYDALIDEEWIKDIGNATIDELKNSMDVIIDALEEINITITQGIRDAIASVPDNVGEFLEGTQAVIDGMRESLRDVYSDLYDEEREALSRDDYDDFYLRITSEYGSLEAYWDFCRQN